MTQEISPVLLFIQSFVSQTALYFIIVSLFYFVFWKWGEERFRGARIQARRRANSKQIRFEIKNTLLLLVVTSPVTFIVSMLYASGHTKLTLDAATLGWPTIVATFFALLVFNDAWFYSWHRFLHHPKLFRYVHAVHHKSVDVNPFSSYSFHWFEGLILGIWVMPIALLVPIYMPILGALSGIGLINNVVSHLGYEILPRRLIRIPLLRWINTSTFHNLHHSSLKGNYGLMFRFWDRILGTEHPHYESTFLQRGAKKQAAVPPQTEKNVL
jgi:sterol desaturase/sphingolipid hydroxylase (fatty acid hydroxylase superfamily)